MTFIGRHLALDVGDVRIGVAVCDALGITARPYAVVQRQPEAAAFQRIAAICIDEEIVRIVVGLPLNLRGEFSDQTRSVQAFVERLRAAMMIPIVTFDERYTTVAAEEVLRARKIPPAQRRSQIDAVAASIILQDYLDALPPAPVSDAASFPEDED